jgi:hypothetical protein
MLTSITPLGERGRGQRWGLTSAWLFTGHVLGGAALGALLAAVGATLRTLVGPPDASTAVAVVALVAVAGAAIDLAGRRLPGTRQVDERWLTTYRGWVYGLGFGVQLGFGLVTVVNTALLGAVLVAGVTVSAPAALVLGVVYGITRGVMATATGWVRSLERLRRLHRWLDRSDVGVRRGAATVAALAAFTTVAVA